MEHIVRSIGNTPDIAEYVEEGYEDASEEPAEGEDTETASVKSTSKQLRAKNEQSDDVTPDPETKRLSAGKQSKRISQLSMSDVADRHLRDKTDAIADIIKNISDQCAAAVEGLNLALDADDEEAESSNNRKDSLAPSDDGREQSVRSDGSETGGDDSLLSPDNCNSSLPPTPDLVHNRSSTSMSMASSSTMPERSSQQYSPGELPTKIVEDDDEYAHETETIDDRNPSGKMSKQASEDIMRPNTTRIVM